MEKPVCKCFAFGRWGVAQPDSLRLKSQYWSDVSHFHTINCSSEISSWLGWMPKWIFADLEHVILTANGEIVSPRKLAYYKFLIMSVGVSTGYNFVCVMWFLIHCIWFNTLSSFQCSAVSWSTTDIQMRNIYQSGWVLRSMKQSRSAGFPRSTDPGSDYRKISCLGYDLPSH